MLDRQGDVSRADIVYALNLHADLGPRIVILVTQPLIRPVVGDIGNTVRGDGAAGLRRAVQSSRRARRLRTDASPGSDPEAGLRDRGPFRFCCILVVIRPGGWYSARIDEHALVPVISRLNERSRCMALRAGGAGGLQRTDEMTILYCA